jgi:tetratricopeptide (TPR) repeat protein
VSKLLEIEIDNLAALLASTPRQDRDRPAIVRRLAQSYLELASSNDREGDAAASDRAREARKKAVALFDELATAYRDWCAIPAHAGAPAHGCADESSLESARAHEALGEAEQAAQAYARIIRDMPSSPFVARARYAVAGLWLGAGKTDDARQAYGKVAAESPSREPLSAYAAYRLGYLLWAAGDRTGAVGELSSVMRAAQAYPTLPGYEALGGSACLAIGKVQDGANP